MPKSGIVHKHYRLDPVIIKRAQKVLRTRTETDTIQRALQEVIAEHERNRVALAAHERFLRSGIKIRDVFGNLSD